MQFFSGFSLKNEAHLFEPYLKNSQYCVAGFSYGAIKAFQDAQKQLQEGKRLDTLQLFSPAFFQTKSKKFHRLQMLAYTKERKKYMQNFIESCFAPYEKKELEFQKTTKEELAELLGYEWSLSELVELQNKGVIIEVYLGEKDAIIDVEAARTFFLDVATVTYIKEANHFLQRD